MLSKLFGGTAPREAAEVPPAVSLGDLHRITDRLERLESALEAQRAELTLAIDEGITHVDRAERRVRAVIQSARRRMESAGYVDEGLEAESAQLQLLHGGGGDGEGLQPVPADVGRPLSGPPGVPGYFAPEYLEALRRA
jgi:hypothetical protein